MALGAAWVCAWVLAVARVAAAAPDVERVLIPETSEVVADAFARMRPTLSLAHGSIENNRIDAVVCAADQDCFAIRLDDLVAGCAEPAGPFCLTFPPARDAATRRPTPEEIAVLRRALATIDGKLVWREIVDTARGRRHGPSNEEPPSATAAIATTLALVLVPFGTGAAAGAAVLRARGRRLVGLLPVLVALIAPVAVAVIVARPSTIGFWDAALAALTAGAAFVWIAHAAFEERARRWLVLGSAAIACLVAEGAARLLLPQPPGFPPAREARLFTSRSDGHGHALICNTTYGNGWPVDHDDRTSRADTYRVPTGYARRALFIGDSMTWGVGVKADETYPALLGAADPKTLVVNGAASAIGPDGYLVLMRQWLPKLDPDLVVFGLFDGNDLTDIDAPLSCCGDQPLLAYDEKGPRLRCPHASAVATALSVRAYLASPPPYLLRVLAGSSTIASYAAVAFTRLRAMAGPSGERDAEGATAHLEAILRAARDEVAQNNGAFVLVLLPTRAALENTDPTARHFRGYGLRMTEIARRLEIPLLDPWESFQVAVREHGSAALFADEIHLSAEGHRLLANWLRDRLPSAAATARARRP